MVNAAPVGLAQGVRRASPRAAVLTGGALMVAGQSVFAVVTLTGTGLPSLDTSALLVIPAVLTGIVMLWLGPVVVATAAGQPGWMGAIAFPGGYTVWILGMLWASSLADGATLTVLEGALPVLSFAGALAVVGGGWVGRRVAAVAVIAGLTGALSYSFEGAPAVVYVGLVVAFGVLAWITPRTRPSSTFGSSNAAGRPPAAGK